MTPDKLRALADTLSSGTHYVESPELHEAMTRAADYLRACADAKPVAWMRPDNRVREESFTGTQFSRGEQRPPIGTWNALYTRPAPAPAAPQAETKREALSDDEILDILDIATAADLRFSMYSDDVETRAAIKRLARAVERAHGITAREAK